MADEAQRTPDPDEEAARQLQLELSEQAEWDQVTKIAREQKLYTGDVLRSQNPAKYKVIVDLLAADVGLLKIAELVKVSHHTVAAIRDAAGQDIAKEKLIISSRSRLGLRLLLERVVNEVADIPLERVAQLVQVLTNTMQLMDGQATSRIETGKSSGPTVESVAEYIKGLDAVEEVTDAAPATNAPPPALPGPMPDDGSKTEGDDDDDE